MIRVLIVDDSAYSRRTIKSMLETSKDIEVVGIAVDGDEALRLVENLQPNVITLDLEMPRMDGFAFLRILTYRRPTPVIVVSSHAGREDVLRALDLGALDFVAKPSQKASKSLLKIRDELVGKIHEAASARMDLYLSDAQPDQVTGFHSIAGLPVAETDTHSITLSPLPKKEPEKSTTPKQIPQAETTRLSHFDDTPQSGSPHRVPSYSGSAQRVPPQSVSPKNKEGVLLIGASTGGPRALRKVLGSLLPDCSWPIVIIQHMPPRFTTEFAARLSRKLEINVREAADGSPLNPGSALIAPGGFHMTIARSRGRPIVRLHMPEKSDRYIPSIDTLFLSARSVFSSNVIGVILTGMGDDGCLGARAIRENGGKIIAEDRSTAVVYGMPRQAIQEGVVDIIAPLDGISSSIQWLMTSIKNN